ncbi:MAG: ABC transporter substrate-binding protein [Anaerolineae bacterium]|nr:ABC transporter substrate-binding protein [Anaerolineae bacterium]
MKDKVLFQNKIGNRGIILTLAVVLAMLLSGCFPAKPKVYKVGILSGSEAFTTITDGFKAGMADLGYVEGENITYDVQQPASFDEWQPVIEQFVADEVDLIFAFPGEPAEVAKAVTQGTDIPVVFVLGAVETGKLVESVRQPGGNITGVRFPLPENTTKRFEILLELAPQTKRLLIEYNPSYANNPIVLETLRPVAASAGVTLVEEPTGDLEKLQANLQARAALDDIGVDAIMLMPEVLSQTPDGLAIIIPFAKEHGLPIAGAMPYTADLGAVFSYTGDNVEMGRLAASSADKILKGTPAGEIPVLTPEQELRINYKVAQELGLTVPESLLNQAAEIIR